jgi:hypothetical protein
MATPDNAAQGGWDDKAIRIPDALGHPDRGLVLQSANETTKSLVTISRHSLVIPAKAGIQ